MEMVMTDSFIQRELGSPHRTEVKRLEEDTRSQTVILRRVEGMMEEARGSWRTILAISGAAAAIGGLLVKFSAIVFPALPK